MSMLRKHDWRFLDYAFHETRHVCTQCSVYRTEDARGVRRYRRPGPDYTYEEYEVLEEPCCSPAFEPEISPEEMLKAGFVSIAEVEGALRASGVLEELIRDVLAGLRSPRQGEESAQGSSREG